MLDNRQVLYLSREDMDKIGPTPGEIVPLLE